jgi:hypothetical protein
MLTLQNTILKGRPIFVREDRERLEGNEANRLYVGNLGRSMGRVECYIQHIYFMYT